MNYLVDQLRLAEKAAEDIYFARIDRELIEALHHLARVSAADAESFEGGRIWAEAPPTAAAGQTEADER